MDNKHVMNKVFFVFLVLCTISDTLVGQFAYPELISPDTRTFASPFRTLSADLDLDGDMDIIASSFFLRIVVWYENIDGEGTLGRHKVIGEIPPGALLLQVVDVDGNGTPDLVYNVAGTLFWHSNTIRKTANFGEALTLATSPYNNITSFTVEDVDDDGVLDIVAANSASTGWLKGRGGDSGFHPFSILSSVIGGLVRFIDIDNDDKKDLIGFRTSTGNWSLEWMPFLEEEGGFGAPIMLIGNMGRVDQMEMADIDGDGMQDVLIRKDTDVVRWYRNTGNFVYDGFITNVIASTLTVADIDQDERLEVVAGVGKDLTVLRFSETLGDIIVAEVIFRGSDYRFSNIECTDMNGDGINDIIAVSHFNLNEADQGVLMFGTGIGAFATPIEFIADSDRVSAVFCADVSGDGQNDLIVGAQNYCKITWQSYNTARNAFDAPRLIPLEASVGDIVESIAVGDIDGDGDNDVMAIISSSSYNFGKLLWFRNIDGQGRFSEEIELENYGVSYYKVLLADIDGDGDLDLAFKSGLLMYWRENLDGLGAFSPKQEMGYLFGEKPILTDYDSDGDLDLLSISSVSIEIIENTATGFESRQLQAMPNGSATLSFVDLNGDNHEDLIIQSEGNVTYFRMYNSEILSFDEAVLRPEIQQYLSSIYPTDIDNDGDIDLFFISYPAVYLRLNDGNGHYDPAITVVSESLNPNYFWIGEFVKGQGVSLVYHTFAGGSAASRFLYFVENLGTIGYPTIRGSIFFDENENGLEEEGEVKLPLQYISVDPVEQVTFSQESSGYFDFTTDDGSFTVSCLPDAQFHLTTPSSLELTVDRMQGTQQVSFGLSAFPLANISLSISSAPTRCNEVIPVYIQALNSGTVMGDIQVAFFLHPLVSYVGANPAPDSIVNNYAYWSFDSVAVYQRREINLLLQIADETFIGEFVELSGIADIVETGGVRTARDIEGSKSLIRCSYDPNDKLVDPFIEEFPNYTLFGDTLDYTVRFQNTGNDTAFVVRIEDFLDSKLDWSTLRVTAASHAYEVKLDQQSGRVQFIFDNILLPDSTTNTIASNGFIRFSIQHKDNLPEFSYVENQARIFFDYNPPIITNTTENILVSQYPLELVVHSPTCHGAFDGRISIATELPFFESYLWSTGDTESHVDSLSEGVYNLLVNLVTGGVIDTTITIVEPDELIPTLSGYGPVSCYGGDDGYLAVAIDGGTPPYQYLWSTGSGDSEMMNLSSGDYQFTVRDSNQCLSSLALTVSEPDSIAIISQISPDINGELTGSITLNVTGGSPPYMYTWSHSLSESSGSVEFLEGGIYSVTVTDAQGCEAQEILSVDDLTGGADLRRDCSFRMLPNPARGWVTILFDGQVDAGHSVIIRDISGKYITEIKPSASTTLPSQMEVSLNSGVYIVSLFFEATRIESKKLIVVP